MRRIINQMAGALLQQPPARHRKGYFPCKASLDGETTATYALRA